MHDAAVIVAGVLLVVAGLLGLHSRKAISDRLLARKHKRANAGKVRCEDAECNLIAEYYTPNGFYCSWHHAPYSVVGHTNGRVRWSRKLHHARVRR